MSKPKRVRVWLVTANIGRGVSTSTASRNIARVFVSFFTGARDRLLAWWLAVGVIIGWQEIDETDLPDEHGLLHRLAKRLAPPGVSWVGWPTATPILVPPGWRVVWESVSTTSPGRGKPAPPPHTPHRVCVRAVLEHVATGIRIRVSNGHWPRDEIADLWAICDESWRELYGEWEDTPQGYTTARTSDRNKRSPRKLAARERQHLPAWLIDEVSTTEAEGPYATSVRVIKTKRVNLGVDGHDAWGVLVEFTAAA